MRHRIVRITMCVLWALALAGCNVPNGKAVIGAPPPGVTRAWFDFPRDGMVLPPGAYDLVSHGADPGGVAQMEWSINGEVVSTSGLEQAVSTVENLSEFHYPWTPEQPGEYILSVRAQSNGGVWGYPAEVVVTIPGEMTVTSSPTVTETVLTITPSLTPTETATATATVTPTVDNHLALVDATKSGGSFYYGGCTPDSITFSVRATQPKAVSYMYLFYKLQDKQSGEQTASNGGAPMTKSGADRWTLTVKANEIKDFNRFDESWFVYQFIVQGGNDVIARSKQLSDVTFSTCSGAPAEPAGGITPSPDMYYIIPME